MTKAQYLAALDARLARLPGDERARSIAFYEEMIADRMEDGLSEDEAIAGMESPDKAAERILAESGAQVTLTKKNSPGRTALLILGAPLWLPLLIAFAAIVVSLAIALGAVVLSLAAALWAVWFAVGATCFAAIVAGAATVFVASFGRSGSWSGEMMQLGAGFMTTGIGILLIPATKKITAAAAESTKYAYRKIGAQLSRLKGVRK